MKIANVALDGSKTYGPWLLAWLACKRPDIVTLQKIGSREHFPASVLSPINYNSRFLLKTDAADLGVGILSKKNLGEPKVRTSHLPGAEGKESRFLTVEIGGLWVSSVYAPYRPGGPKMPCKDAIKLRVAWLDRLRDEVSRKGYADRDSVLCGDLNVKARSDGPLKKMGGCYSEEEQIALEKLLDFGFVDLYRKRHPEWNEYPGHTRGYSRRFPDGTSRLHLMLASESLASRLKTIRVDNEPNPFIPACGDNSSNCWPREDSPPLILELEGQQGESRSSST